MLIPVTRSYWNHVPSDVVESLEVKFCETLIIMYTDCVLATQLPDVVVIDKVVLIVDVAVPSDCNVTMKETEKIEKYKLLIEISSLWKMKGEVIPVVVGGLGCVTAMLDVYLHKLGIRGETIRVNAVLHIAFECIAIYCHIAIFW